MKYQPIHVSEELIKAINERNLFNIKIQTDHFDSEHFILQDNHSDKYKDNV